MRKEFCVYPDTWHCRQAHNPPPRRWDWISQAPSPHPGGPRVMIGPELELDPGDRWNGLYFKHTPAWGCRFLYGLDMVLGLLGLRVEWMDWRGRGSCCRSRWFGSGIFSVFCFSVSRVWRCLLSTHSTRMDGGRWRAVFNWMGNLWDSDLSEI
ncbi:hypothetical protein BO71DRAFT_97064 [Aspergillus ellipticus CBS 707.79]|uniref:Uncharacterized protein n=1 Tax=Aspergillus ellipticus CBS 707.79 TaxID=1448320 RepID=A0A319CZ30_9EURO|nr:hypothetical protein BO71DRAFT_97064 [Aspergillus ellipticus CBS 707.79]